MPNRPKRPMVGSQRHPFEVFLLALCVVSGLSLLLGSPPPGSINSTLDPLARNAWALMLAGGSIAALIGGSLPGGIFVEQVGLVAVGSGTLVYAVAIVATAGAQGLFAAGITLAFGAACCWRWWQLQRLIREARRS